MTATKNVTGPLSEKLLFLRRDVVSKFQEKQNLKKIKKISVFLLTAVLFFYLFDLELVNRTFNYSEVSSVEP